jgi:hypothetical protein
VASESKVEERGAAANVGYVTERDAATEIKMCELRPDCWADRPVTSLSTMQLFFKFCEHLSLYW